MQTIKNRIVKALREYLGCDVVPTDTADRKPDYPYISYKITGPLNSAGGFSLTDKAVSSASPDFEVDIEVTRKEQAQFTMSISAYSMDGDEACELSIKAADWFNFIGYEYLKELNVVVIHVSNIGDRTAQIVDDYEKRFGFDVRCRAARAVKKLVETIEVFNFNKTNVTLTKPIKERSYEMAKKDFTVNITKLTKAVSQQGFGLPFILGTSKDAPYTLYDDISGVVEAYSIESKEYKIASRIFGQNPAPQQVAIFSILPDDGFDLAELLLETVNEVTETNNDWYFLTCTENTDEVIKTLAEWADTQIKTYWTTTQNPELVSQMENENAIVMYHEDEEAYAAEGLVSIAATHDPGSLTFKFKTVTGVTGSEIRSTDLNNLHDNGGFSYIKKMGDLQTTEGTVTTGEYIDIVMAGHWVKCRMEEEAAYLAKNNDKIPYDNRGIAMLVSVVDAVIKRAGKQGIVMTDDNGNYVYSIEAISREDTSKNDVASRIYNGISWTLELSGAIHSGTISGTFTY